MPIYAGTCFQSKNEISDKLMRNDFNVISIRNTRARSGGWNIADRFANTSKLADIGKFLIAPCLMAQIKYQRARAFFKSDTCYDINRQSF